MSHDLRFESALAPEEVLAALARYATNGHETAVPHGLRKRGFVPLQVSVNGRDFRLQYGRGRARRPTVFICEGSVVSQPQGGSMIHARLRRDVAYVGLAAVGAGFIFLWTVTRWDDMTSTIVTGLITVIVAGSYFLQRALPVSPHTPQGDEFRRVLRGAAQGNVRLPAAAPQN